MFSALFWGVATRKKICCLHEWPWLRRGLSSMSNELSGDRAVATLKDTQVQNHHWQIHPRNVTADCEIDYSEGRTESLEWNWSQSDVLWVLSGLCVPALRLRGFILLHGGQKLKFQEIGDRWGGTQTSTQTIQRSWMKRQRNKTKGEENKLRK